MDVAISPRDCPRQPNHFTPFKTTATMRRNPVTFPALVCALVFFTLAADVNAKAPCEINYTQEGSFLMGRRFSTWDAVPTATPEVAFKRIYLEGVKSGLKVAHSDKDIGILSFEQSNAGVTNTGQQVNLPWNVTIEADGTGSKVSVSKTTPGGYATSQEFQITSMCAVIDAARK